MGVYAKFNKMLRLGKTFWSAKSLRLSEFTKKRLFVEKRRAMGHSKTRDDNKRLRVVEPEQSTPFTEIFQMDDCDSEKSWEVLSQSSSNESWEVLPAVMLHDAGPTEYYTMCDTDDEEYAMA